MKELENAKRITIEGTNQEVTKEFIESLYGEKKLLMWRNGAGELQYQNIENQDKYLIEI